MSLLRALLMLGAKGHAEPVVEACDRFGIRDPLEQAHFIAQLAVESGRFTSTAENLNYSVDGLLKTFGRHRISEADARKFGRFGAQKAHQNALANILYGGAWGARELGNTEPGDGWRFRGRGLKQITGRTNYRMCSLGLFGDERLLNEPEMLEFEPLAALSAGWFWTTHRGGECVRCARRDDIEAVTRVVNGGQNGIERRRDALTVAKKYLGVS